MSFIIRSFDFRYYQDLAWWINLSLVDNFPVAATGGAIAAVNVINAGGIYAWEGFEISDESTIKVALFPKPVAEPLNPQVTFADNYNEFIDTWARSIQWMTVTEARIQLETWESKTLQILLYIPQFERLQAGRVGFWIAENQLDYVFNYALPHGLKTIPFQLVRWVKVGSDRFTLPLPPNLNAERFLSVQSRRQSVNLQVNKLRLQSPQEPDSICQLLISTTLKVDCIRSESAYQLTEFPCLVLRVTERTKDDYRMVAFQDSVAIPNGRRFNQIEYWRGQIVEVAVFAETFGDRQMIADTVMGFFSGFDLPLPLFGSSIPVQVVSPGKEIPNFGSLTAVKPAQQFEICVWGIPVGEKSWTTN